MAWSGVFDLNQRLAALEERTSHVQPIAKRVSNLEDQFEQKFPPRRTSSRVCPPLRPLSLDVCPASRHEIDFPTDRGLDIVDVNEGSEGVPSRVAKKWKGHYETNE